MKLKEIEGDKGIWEISKMFFSMKKLVFYALNRIMPTNKNGSKLALHVCAVFQV